MRFLFFGHEKSAREQTKSERGSESGSIDTERALWEARMRIKILPCRDGRGDG